MKRLTLSLLIFCFAFFVFSQSVQSASHKKYQANAAGGLSHGKTSSRKLKTKANPTDAFCKKFKAQCYRSAIKDKTEQVNIVHACQRNKSKQKKSKKSPLYTFGCKSDGQDITEDVLNKITNPKGTTKGINGTIAKTETETSTTTKKVTNVLTDTQYATETSVITTAIPITKTTTSTETLTEMKTFYDTVSTSYVYTTTIRTWLGNNRIPIVRVKVSSPLSGTQKRVTKVDDSQFCSSFNAGCKQECKRVNSTDKHIFCQAVDALQYSLTCVCKNKKIETQHALEVAANQQQISSISTILTSTSYGPETTTINAPTKVISTSFATVTTVIPVTSTITSLTTITATKTEISRTGQSTIVATTTPKIFETETASTTTSLIATSTTQIVLPTIGALQVIDSKSFVSQGYIYTPDTDDPLYYLTSDRSKAVEYFAVYDSVSRLYQLQLADGSNQAFITEGADPQSDFSNSGYAFTYSGDPSSCGTSGNSAGPPAGGGMWNFNGCETFIFSTSSVVTEITKGEKVDLLPNWINPGQMIALQYYWILFLQTKFLAQASTPTYAHDRFNEEGQAVHLLFPA